MKQENHQKNPGQLSLTSQLGVYVQEQSLNIKRLVNLSYDNLSHHIFK